MLIYIGKSDDPDSPDYIPSVNLGYQKFKTPDMDQYRRATAGSAEKERKYSKRKLQLHQEQSHFEAADALVDLSNYRELAETDYGGDGNDKENSGGM